MWLIISITSAGESSDNARNNNNNNIMLASMIVPRPTHIMVLISSVDCYDFEEESDDGSLFSVEPDDHNLEEKINGYAK